MNLDMVLKNDTAFSSGVWIDWFILTLFISVFEIKRIRETFSNS